MFLTIGVYDNGDYILNSLMSNTERWRNGIACQSRMSINKLTINTMKTFEFTDEQVQMLARCIRTTILTKQDSKEKMLKAHKETIYTKELSKDIDDDVVRLQTLLNYIIA